MDPQHPGPPPTLRILAGGEPSAEELAALVLALTPTAGPSEAAPAAPSGWRRAAVLEAVGGRPATSPADLDVVTPHG